MAIKSTENALGAWAFLIGVILAIVIGLSATLMPIPFITKYSAQIYSVLMILGIIIGFMNVTGRESHTFMISGAVVVIVSKYGMESVFSSLIGIGMADTASSVFGALLALFVPATIIVALKTVFSISKI